MSEWNKTKQNLRQWWKKWEIDNSKLGSTQQQKICSHWHVARIISSQKIYGLYGLKHHIVEIRGDVTMRDGRRTTNDDNKQVKIELLSRWKLEAEFCNISKQCADLCLPKKLILFTNITFQKKKKYQGKLRSGIVSIQPDLQYVPSNNHCQYNP